MSEKCWICGKPKGQPPERCPGHYELLGVTSVGEALRQRVAELEGGWRCYHCGKMFTDEAEAAEHFGGDRNKPKPAGCEAMLQAIAETFEAVGIHRNFHNAASVRLLASQRDKIAQHRNALGQEVADLRAAIRKWHERANSYADKSWSLNAREMELETKEALAPARPQPEAPEKELAVWLCPVHQSLDDRGELRPLDNCVACLRVERDELRASIADASSPQRSSAALMPDDSERIKPGDTVEHVTDGWRQTVLSIPNPPDLCERVAFFAAGGFWRLSQLRKVTPSPDGKEEL